MGFKDHRSTRERSKNAGVSWEGQDYKSTGLNLLNLSQTDTLRVMVQEWAQLTLV